MRFRTGRELRLGLVLIISLGICGCKTTGRHKSAPQPVAADIGLSPESHELLKLELRILADFIESELTRTADQIESETGDRNIARAALLSKLELLLDMRDDLAVKEPQRLLIDWWALWVRVARYLKEGDGKNLYGSWQPNAIECADNIVRELERVARAHLPAEQQLTIVRQINAYARAHPIHNVYKHEMVRDFGEAEEGRGIVESMVALPFEAVGAVGKSLDPAAILSENVDRFTDLMADYPAMLRWQLQLLLLDLDRLSSVVSTVDSLQRATDAASAFYETADALPERIRAELQTLLDDLDTRQPELRTTLREARETITAADQVLARAENVAGRVGEVTNGVTRAGEAWTETAVAVKVVVDQIQQFAQELREESDAVGEALPESSGAIAATSQPGEGEPREPKLDVRDYTRTAEALTEAVGELRSLLAELEEFAQGDAIERSTAQVNSLADDVLVHTEGRLRGVVDHVFWRALQLAIIVLVIVIAFRAVVRHASRTA